MKCAAAARRRARCITCCLTRCPPSGLILFEVYVPGGNWSGWPPHRHDEVLQSPYLEETYHFRFDKPQSFGLHRNYSPETRL